MVFENPISPSVSVRNALLEGQLRGTFLILLLQMAEANNVDMHSGNENEEQLLQSDGENGPRANAASSPREVQHEPRRVRRMNRREREEREIARDRRRQHRHQESVRRHRSSSQYRQHLNDRNDRRVQQDRVARHHEERFSMRRSKLPYNIMRSLRLFNVLRFLQNAVTDVEEWVMSKRNATVRPGSVQKRKLRNTFLMELPTYIIDY